MSGSIYKLIAAFVVVLVLGIAGGYWFARRDTHSMNSSMPPVAAGERKVLYWYDPMVPNQHFDKPGKSPFMDMQLVPKYAGEGGEDSASIQIDPSIVQNLGVRLTTVERGSLSQPIDVVGGVTFNQRTVAIVQTRTNGFVTRVYARASGDVLRRDAPLVDLLVPEWAGAQAEFLALLKSSDRELVDAARQRLVLAGMTAELIEKIEKERQPQTTVTIRSPIAGAIESLEVREGMTLGAGVTIAKINGLDTVWIEAAIPEAQGGFANLGKSVEVRLTAYPGDVFQGQVVAVLPETNAETRTLRARIEVPNPDQRLRPGMFAQVRLDAGDGAPVLYVDSQAIIRTGSRDIVLLAEDGGRFTPIEVQIGTEVRNKTVVLKGLTEGQKVVASGQFLIDSEASLKGVLTRLQSKVESESTNATVEHTP